MARSPQEIVTHHSAAMAAGDIDEIVADYTDDAIFITPRGAWRGKDGVRAAFTELFNELPEPKFDVTTRILESDVFFLEWTAMSANGRATNGVDTFVFSEDGIRVQTVRYTLDTTA